MWRLNLIISLILSFSILFLIVLIGSQILNFSIIRCSKIYKLIIGLLLIANGLTLIICILLSLIKKLKLWCLYSILSIKLLILGIVLIAFGLVLLIKLKI